MSQTASTASPRGDGSALRQFSEFLARDVACAQVMLVSTMPRGGLQVLQPIKLSEALVKAYVREWQAEDDSTWKALATGKAVKASASSRYVEAFLKPFGFAYAVTLPVADPALDGYPGVVQLHRTGEQGPFTEAELGRAMAAAGRLGELLADVRAGRAAASGRAGSAAERTADGWAHMPPTRIFALDATGRVVFAKAAFADLDDRIRDQMVAEARGRTAKLNGEPWVTARVMLPDSVGDHWTGNAVVYRRYPSLGDGPVVFFCLQPTCPEWSALRSADFIADPEMSRLIPALRFMQAEFHRGPTLTEIARTVHLSPFHFHRRFTELMGLTPKHFMLECQIHDAKGELVAGEKELAKIASDCGFAHQSHFTSRFKQATGLTPTRWRRMAFDRINGVE